MKYSLALLPVFFAQLCFAQFTIKQIRDSTHTFIEIQSPQHPDLAKKINQVIQKDWSYDPAAKNPFENMMSTEDASFNYSLSANNDRVLSLVIESSYAAAGLHITRTPYIFDSHTGASIDQAQLFGVDGLAKLKKVLYKSFKDILKAASSDGDSRAAEYKACLTSDDASEFNIDRMLMTDTGISIWAGSCLEGTTYDFEADRSHGPHEYSLGKLLPMLTPYGYSCFVSQHAAPLQTLLRGTIDGKYPISMTLLPGKDGAIGGMIVYDRVDEPINLSGTMQANQLVIHEVDGSNKPVSNIEVSWDGTKLTGSFINLTAKKQMAFLATVVK